MKPFNFYRIKADLKRTFILSVMLSLTVFAFLRIIFLDIPFSLNEEGVGLLKIIAIYWMILFLIKTALNLVILVGEIFQRISPISWLAARSKISAALTVCFMSIMLFACNIATTGIRKDLSTGMVTNIVALYQVRRA